MFSRPGGDPSDLHCHFCPNIYGYLYQCAAPASGTAEKPVFAHLHCYLFIAGSTIRSFCPLVLQAPQVNVLYKGIYQDPSAFLVPYSVPFVRSETPTRPQARSLVTRSVSNAERRSASDTPPRMEAVATQNVAATLIFNNTKTEFVPAEITPLPLFTDYQSTHLNNLEDSYNENRKLNNLPTDRFSSFLLPHSIEITPRRRVEAPLPSSITINKVSGMLCSICRVPLGLTLRCAQPGCPHAVHPSCLWYIGGELTVDSTLQYVGSGVSPHVRVFCVEHQPVGATRGR